MTDFFLDSSAMAKRYADEPGSDRVRKITAPDNRHTVLLAEITLVEVAAVLAAKHRTPQGLTRDQRDQVLSRFLQDCAEQFRHPYNRPQRHRPGCRTHAGSPIARS